MSGLDRDRAITATATATATALADAGIGYALLDQDWRILTVNTVAEQITGAAAADLIGRDHWQAFPGLVGTDFERAYHRARTTAEPVTFEAFSPPPVDAWVEVRAVPRDDLLHVYFTDLAVRRATETARARAEEQQRTDARAMASLVAVAQDLGEADTEAAVLAVLTSHGGAVLDAQAMGLAFPEPATGQVRTFSSGFSADFLAAMAHLPADLRVPLVDTTRTGRAHFYPDLAATAADFPDTTWVYPRVGTDASAALPLVASGRLLGCLSVAHDGPHTWRPAERELLGALATLTAQALARIEARTAEAAARQGERAAAEVIAGFAETLQRSMLTEPPQPDDLQVAVRYTPALVHAEVGGDWYDAFVTSTGTTSLAIGDVTGHDMRAAAVMGQLRNLLGGIGFHIGAPPAVILAAVDRAAMALGVDVVSTVVLAQVEQTEEQRAAGLRTLRWSNAGHLPPLLMRADGTTSYLEEKSDLVLGWDAGVIRHDHELELAPGDRVLLYTDGLVERRGVGLDRGLAWLLQAAGELAGATVEELCDGLLAVVDGHLDDDVALLALHAHPQAASGPSKPPPLTRL